ncbi:MAG: DUF2231 domain-containing protein [Gemmatimonadota bacterium]
MPDPLHPAVVHFPIVLVVLVPIFAVGSILAIRRGAHTARAWGVTTAMVAALAASAWLAVETGEAEEERVEEVVSERVLHDHEEAAETFLLMTAITLLVASAGFAPGRAGGVARMLTAIGAVALLGTGLTVGRSGGELVYRHGAASAYTNTRAADADATVERDPRRADEADVGERDEHED